MNIALIVAAGRGDRFGGSVPKQFVEILGKPILFHTLERFEACVSVDEIYLVLSDTGRSLFGSAAVVSQFPKLKGIVDGGETRANSVRNGLEAIDAKPTDIIAVHDGARPMVEPDEIARTIEAAKRSGAACLVAEVTDTIKKTDAGIVMATIDRTKLRRALTPQAFRFDLLTRAFANAEDLTAVTDECYLVERLGAEITAVEGSDRNIKITRADDLKIAEVFLREQCSE